MDEQKPALDGRLQRCLFVVTYVDFLEEVLDTDPDRGQEELAQYGAATSNANGFLNFTILQQLDRPNRAAVLEVWATQGNYETWQGSATTTKFIKIITPLLGSPLDHRLNILCGETFDGACEFELTDNEYRKAALAASEKSQRYRLLSRRSRNQTGRQHRTQTLLGRTGNSDDPPIHIRPVCSRRCGCKG